MVAMANTVMRGGVNTVTSTPTSPTDTTASRTSVISITVTVYSAGPSFRAFEKSDRKVVEQRAIRRRVGGHEAAPSLLPLRPIAAVRLAQELVQLVDGQGRRARMARGYLAQEIEVVPHEDPEVPRVGRLVDADEVPPRAGSREEAAPFSNRHQPDRIEAVREEGDEQLVKGGRSVEIFLQRAPRALGIEDHPEWDGSSANRPEGLHQDEGVDHEAIVRGAEARVPPAIQVCHERAHGLRLLEHDAPDPVPVAPREALHVLPQRGREPPLGLGAGPIRGRRLPSSSRRSVVTQIGFHAVAAMHHLVRGGAPERSELEDVPVAPASRRPL